MITYDYWVHRVLKITRTCHRYRNTVRKKKHFMTNVYKIAKDYKYNSSKLKKAKS